LIKTLRLLLVIPVPPLPFNNAAGRWFYVLLKGLVERGHQVTAFTVCSTSKEISQVQELFPEPNFDVRCYLIPEHQSLITKIKNIQRPYSYIFSPKLQNDLNTELAKDYDILHCEVIWSGWLGLKHKKRTVVNIHYLFSLDQTFEPAITPLNKLRKFITYGAEQRLLKAFPKIITLSERLTKHIEQINPKAKIYTVPLGIDISFYPFVEHKQINQQPVVSLIGGLDWAPSYTAAIRLITRLWPEIKRRVPNAKLQIVGRSAANALSKFSSNINDLEIHQDVPDILPYFANTDVLLYAPIAGSGMKVKILEAFALGTPVVTTFEGVEGIPAEDGVHAGICDDDQGLIEKTIELLNNPSLQKMRRLKARELLENHCSPQITLEKIETVYKAIGKSYGKSFSI
jgi:polysaccharide biosynthesis protein PslH